MSRQNYQPLQGGGGGGGRRGLFDRRTDSIQQPSTPERQSTYALNTARKPVSGGQYNSGSQVQFGSKKYGGVFRVTKV
jgi:hypothetical protein